MDWEYVIAFLAGLLVFIVNENKGKLISIFRKSKVLHTFENGTKLVFTFNNRPQRNHVLDRAFPFKLVLQDGRTYRISTVQQIAGLTPENQTLIMRGRVPDNIGIMLYGPNSPSYFLLKINDGAFEAGNWLHIGNCPFDKPSESLFLWALRNAQLRQNDIRQVETQNRQHVPTPIERRAMIDAFAQEQQGTHIIAEKIDLRSLVMVYRRIPKQMDEIIELIKREEASKQ